MAARRAVRSAVNGRADWSEAHMRYLRHLSMPSEAHGIVLEEYIQAIDSARERVARMKKSLIELLGEWEWEPVVRALMAFKGLSSFVGLCVEASHWMGRSAAEQSRKSRP
jgi:hypothetical protein